MGALRAAGFVALCAVVGFWILPPATPLLASTPLGNILKVPAFSATDMPDMRGKVVIITGANTGLGYSSARELYRHNAQVVMAVRSVSRGEEAANQIRHEVTASEFGSLSVLELELSSLKSVRNFADTFMKRFNSLDVLMLNAGVMGTPFTLSTDGIELQFATNHVGHWLLADLLMPSLKATAPARIVVLSSSAHHRVSTVPLTLSDVNDKSTYSPFSAYQRSKLANLLMTKHWAKQLEGTGVTINAVHPGLVHTEILRGLQQSFGSFLTNMVAKVVFLMAYHSDDAVWTQLGAAASPTIPGVQGKYYGPIFREFPIAPPAFNATLAQALDNFTRDLVTQHQ